MANKKVKAVKKKNKNIVIYGYKYKLFRLLRIGVLMCGQNLVGR